MAGDVGVDLEEGGGAEAAEAVKAGEDFVQDYGEAGPLVGIVGVGLGDDLGPVGEEGGVGADDLDEGVLK